MKNTIVNMYRSLITTIIFLRPRSISDRTFTTSSRSPITQHLQLMPLLYAHEVLHDHIIQGRIFLASLWRVYTAASTQILFVYLSVTTRTYMHKLFPVTATQESSEVPRSTLLYHIFRYLEYTYDLVHGSICTSALRSSTPRTLSEVLLFPARSRRSPTHRRFVISCMLVQPGILQPCIVYCDVSHVVSSCNTPPDVQA
jgi:hypothetical protein